MILVLEQKETFPLRTRNKTDELVESFLEAAQDEQQQQQAVVLLKKLILVLKYRETFPLRTRNQTDVLVEKFVMIGNTETVRRVARNVPFLQGYASGKDSTEKALRECFGNQGCIIKVWNCSTVVCSVCTCVPHPQVLHMNKLMTFLVDRVINMCV